MSLRQKITMATNMKNSQKPDMIIIDDEKALRLLLKEFFKDKFNVTTLQTGHGCMDHMYTNPVPKVAIIDLGLPDVSGLELITRLRKESKWDDMVIVVLSSREASTDRIAALRAGADDYLQKPFNPEELEVRIGAILRRIERHAAVPA